MKESGVFSFGFPYSSKRPALIMAFFNEAFGPNPHFRGYTSRSMMTRLILATTLKSKKLKTAYKCGHTHPWSQVAITAVVI